jgi:hypothetical protein
MMLPNRLSQIAKFRNHVVHPLLRPSQAGRLDASSLSYLQVGIILIGQRHLSSVLHLLLVLLENSLVNCDLGRSQSGCGNEFLIALVYIV